MQVRILNYVTSARVATQGFFDCEVDGWIRLNGLHLERDGSLKAMQLTPFVGGKRLFRPAVEIPDPDLREVMAMEILAALHAHIATLPPEQRLRAPLTPEELAQNKAKRAAEKPKAPVLPQQPARFVSTNQASRQIAKQSVPEKLKPQLPLLRLLAGVEQPSAARKIGLPHARNSD
jgi:hypothetical protein